MFSIGLSDNTKNITYGPINILYGQKVISPSFIPENTIIKYIHWFSNGDLAWVHELEPTVAIAPADTFTITVPELLWENILRVTNLQQSHI